MSSVPKIIAEFAAIDPKLKTAEITSDVADGLRADLIQHVLQTQRVQAGVTNVDWNNETLLLQNLAVESASLPPNPKAGAAAALATVVKAPVGSTIRAVTQTTTACTAAA